MSNDKSMQSGVEGQARPFNSNENRHENKYKGRGNRHNMARRSNTNSNDHKFVAACKKHRNDRNTLWEAIAEKKKQLLAVADKIDALNKNSNPERDNLISQKRSKMETISKLKSEKAPLIEAYKQQREYLKQQLSAISVDVDKFGPKSLEAIDKRLDELNKTMESTSYRPIEESRYLKEISKLKKIKEQVASKSKVVDKVRQETERLRQHLDAKTAEIEKIVKEISELNVELEKYSIINSTHKEAMQKLKEEREKYRNELREEEQKFPLIEKEFKEAQAKHAIWLENEKAKQEQRAQKHSIEKEIRELNDKLKNLEINPMAVDLYDCISVQNFFQTDIFNETPQQLNSKQSSTHKTETAEKSDGRRIHDNGLQVLIRSEESYLGKTSSQKSSKKTRNAENSSKRLALPHWIVAHLAKFQVPPPSNIAMARDTLARLNQIKIDLDAKEKERLVSVVEVRETLQDQILMANKRLEALAVED